MDIHCKHCGEPLDMDELHYVDADNHPGEPKAESDPDYITFEAARRLFYKLGCGIFSEPPKPCSNKPICNETKLQGIEALQDLLGDDVDGLAAMTEDAEFGGLFDE